METVKCTHCGKRFRVTYQRCSRCLMAAPGNIGGYEEDMRLVNKLIRVITEEVNK